MLNLYSEKVDLVYNDNDIMMTSDLLDTYSSKGLHSPNS